MTNEKHMSREWWNMIRVLEKRLHVEPFNQWSERQNWKRKSIRHFSKRYGLQSIVVFIEEKEDDWNWVNLRGLHAGSDTTAEWTNLFLALDNIILIILILKWGRIAQFLYLPRFSIAKLGLWSVVLVRNKKLNISVKDPFVFVIPVKKK